MVSVNIVSFGDSFTFGNELPGDNPGPSKVTWAGKIADKINCNYECRAEGGNSNSAITRSVIDWLAHKEESNDSMAMIMWTFPGRYEYMFNHDNAWHNVTPWEADPNIDVLKKQYKNFDEETYKENKEKLEKIKGTPIEFHAKSHFEHIDSHEYASFMAMKEILLTQNTLHYYNVPYMCCFAHNSIFNLSPGNTLIYSLLDQSRWFQFDNNQGFMQWAEAQGFKFGSTHPLEDAHEEAAKLMSAWILDNY
tara:strand:+ start:60399 stop:61148 length:750 start_codon:yes stop_codon:yes gene_type:complete